VWSNRDNYGCLLGRRGIARDQAPAFRHLAWTQVSHLTPPLRVVSSPHGLNNLLTCTCRGVLSPSRCLGACLRRCCWMRTAFSSRRSSQLFFKSSMLCSVTFELFFVRFFHRLRLFPLVLQQSFELLHISCFPGFS
jgi:hypothetical protein